MLSGQEFKGDQSSELEFLQATEYESYPVPDNYEGFRLEKPYHQNALEQLIESVKAKQVRQAVWKTLLTDRAAGKSLFNRAMCD